MECGWCVVEIPAKFSVVRMSTIRGGCMARDSHRQEQFYGMAMAIFTSVISIDDLGDRQV